MKACVSFSVSMTLHCNERCSSEHEGMAVAKHCFNLSLSHVLVDFYSYTEGPPGTFLMNIPFPSVYHVPGPVIRQS